MGAITAPAPEPLSIWTIKSNPRDFPGQHVARRHEESAHGAFATNDHLVADTLDELRAKLPAGLACFSIGTGDDPIILEVWL